MANPEHLKILKQGWPTWNKWREQNASLVPDLSSADLTQIELRTAHLEGANLRNVNLTKVDLHCGYLRGADLSGANLDYTDLSIAYLSGAKLNKAIILNVDFTFTDLNKADLRGATISFVEFRGAKLKNADFSEAFSGYNNYREIDLSEVKGLETVIHTGPSNISIDTIYLSEGTMPKAFLRGCGVPDNFIIQIPSLVAAIQPIQFYSCFISYSSKDEEFASRLYSRMRDENLRVWYAPEEMKGGQKLHEQIFSAIQVHDKLLLVLSENSLQSEWVITEIRRARKTEREEHRRKLFPIRLVDFDAIQKWECFDADSGKDLGVELREYFIPDFSNWKDHDAFETAFNRLLRDLNAEAKLY